MLSTFDITMISILAILCLIIIFILKSLLKKENKSQLERAFILVFCMLIFWLVGLILQCVCSVKFNINPLYFDYFMYIVGCFLPVAVLSLSLIFAKTKITFNKWYFLLCVIPIISLVLLWTNDYHHLFFEHYSFDVSKIVFGKYFYIHNYYTLLLYVISLFILVRYSIKNLGLFSRQAILIFVGVLVPLILNLLETVNIVPTSPYITPIAFSITIICISLAMFKFSLLKTTPIALQRIVDRISDSYIVLNENYEISDFNQTLIDTFDIKNPTEIRGEAFEEFLSEYQLNSYLFKDHIDKIKNNDNTESFELFIKKTRKYFNVEITSIIANKQFLGIIILFKDISQHVNDMQTIKDNQDMLMENERLASLGQLIGGIAHNLKTPIMSIAGATEGLNDLVKEYDSSIGDSEVTDQDHHEIAHDMGIWIDKIKGYTEYMSDIITTVKGQAVTLGTEESYEFTVKELINRVDILMRHELKNALVYLNIKMQTDENTVIDGDINSLVQVINNMISNSIQAYGGKPEQNIDMSFYVKDNNLVISLKDYAGGLPDKVKNKLFKEMVTTKGKDGTGLGLYMSYSNIKARFNGDITFDTNKEGTTFNISLPI